MSAPIAWNAWRHDLPGSTASPAQRDPSSAAGNSGGAWDSAWQLEMERSQAAAWLGKGWTENAGTAWRPEAAAAISASHATKPAPSQASPEWAISASMEESPAPGLAAALRMALSSAVTGVATSPLPASPATASPMPPPLATLADSPAGSARARESSGEPLVPHGAAGKTASGHSLDGTPTPQPSARLHAEWTVQGLRVWLGLDAGVELPTAWLVQQLQRTAASLGSRLLTLTCNGQPVDLRDTTALPAQPSPPAAGASPLFDPLLSHITGR